eukprot:NODE_58_length_28395_cov_1.465720.p4 type:complete len:496 gc:universal NODE_58_length_28395_cov_1.465720:24309-25796(+)
MTLSKHFVTAPDIERAQVKNLQAYQYKKLLSQIITVSSYSVTLLGSFYSRAEIASENLGELYKRLSKLEQALPNIQDRLIAEPFHLGEAEKPQPTLISSSFLSKESRPMEMMAVYEKCKKPPELHKLDQFRSDGKTCMQFYSNPNFFVEEWKKVIEKENEEKKKKRKEKKALKAEKNKNVSADANEMDHRVVPAALDGSPQANISVEYESDKNMSPENDYVIVEANNEPAPLPEADEEFDPEKLFSTIDDLIPGLAGIGLSESPVDPIPMMQAAPFQPPQFGMGVPQPFQMPPPAVVNLRQTSNLQRSSQENLVAPTPVPFVQLKPVQNIPPPQLNHAPVAPTFNPPTLNIQSQQLPPPPQMTPQQIPRPQSGIAQLPNQVPAPQFNNAPPSPMANIAPPPPGPPVDLPTSKPFAPPALRKVEKVEQPAKPSVGRDGMLGEIKTGAFALKKVAASQAPAPVKKEDTTVAGILMRRVALEMSDSDGDDHDDDEEWD